MALHSDSVGGGGGGERTATIPNNSPTTFVDANPHRVVLIVALKEGDKGYLQIKDVTAGAWGIFIPAGGHKEITWNFHGPLAQQGWQFFQTSGADMVITIYEVVKPAGGWPIIP